MRVEVEGALRASSRSVEPEGEGRRGGSREMESNVSFQGSRELKVFIYESQRALTAPYYTEDIQRQRTHMLDESTLKGKRAKGGQLLLPCRRIQASSTPHDHPRHSFSAENSLQVKLVDEQFHEI